MNISGFLLRSCFLAIMFSCSGANGNSSSATPLADPGNLICEKVSDSSARLKWTDNTDDETAYYVFCKTEESSYYIEPSATLPPNSESYLFENLKPGDYYFGVQAKASDPKLNSRIVYSDKYTVENPLPPTPPAPTGPGITLDKTVVSYAYFAMKYSFSGLKSSNPDHGICVSPDHSPTVADDCFPGPVLQSDSALQLIPNAVLDYGKEYHVKVYVKEGGEYYYSEETTITLSAEPETPKLSWQKLSPEGIPSSIAVYETSTPLNGRKFHAWYAVADCTGDVEFRVLNPASKATLEKQAEAAGNCYVLINGGIFGTKHIGVIYANGTKQAWRDEVDGCYWAWDAKLYNLTRAIIGTDATGKPSAYWTSAPDENHVYFYNRTIPVVMQETAYSLANDIFPGIAQNWTPKNALSTGPMLVYGGKCTVDRKSTGNSAVWPKPSGDGASHECHYSNYECWAPDIYPTKPDRTAVGFTADGKIVLFICDGRIADSDGAYIDELALIMKSIGCVAAMNLDGGGSTAMIVNGKRLNSLLTGSGTATENRPVLSTLGFFAK